MGKPGTLRPFGPPAILGKPTLQLLEQVLDAGDNGLFVLDSRRPDSPITYSSPGFQRITGYSQSESEGRDCLFWASEDTGAATAAEVQRSLAEGHTCNVTLQGARKNGTFWWCRLSLSPLRDATGATAHFIGVVVDISDLVSKRAEIDRLHASIDRQVNERTAEYAWANAELEAFSYSVSHDLRAPLRHISGFTELLQKSAAASLDAKSLRYLDTIAASAARAGNLVDALLAFSRMGRAELRLSLSHNDELVEEARRMLEAQFPVAGTDKDSEALHHRATWKISPLPNVFADTDMLRLVWQNLLSNALKYSSTREYPRVEIGSRQEAQSLVFWVRDNGVGFDMAFSDRLFGVFQRLHSTDEFEGTGVGLANVRRIVERHGGRVWAEGEVDKGAVFYFTLPLRPGTPGNDSGRISSQM